MSTLVQEIDPYQSLRNSNEHLQEVIASKTKEIELLRSQCSQLEQSCKDLTAKSTTLITTTINTAEIELKIKNNTLEVINLKQENSTLQNTLFSEKTEKENLSGQLDGHKTMIEEMNRKMEQLTEEIASYKVRNQTLNIEVEESRKSLDETKRSEPSITERVLMECALPNISITELSQGIMYEAEISTLKKQIEKLDEEATEVKQKLDDTDRKVFSLNVKVQDYQDIIERLEKKREEYRIRFDDFQQYNINQSTKVKNLASENQKLKGMTDLSVKSTAFQDSTVKF